MTFFIVIQPDFKSISLYLNYGWNIRKSLFKIGKKPSLSNVLRIENVYDKKRKVKNYKRKFSFNIKKNACQQHLKTVIKLDCRITRFNKKKSILGSLMRLTFQSVK